MDGTSGTLLLHGSPDAVLKAAARHRVLAWNAQDRDLEELFMDFYRVTDDDRQREVAADDR